LGKQVSIIKKGLVLMRRRGIILIVTFLISSIIYAQSSITIEKYQITKIAKPSIKYSKKLDALRKIQKALILGKNWILPFDSNKYLESKITGKKVTDEDSFPTSSLFLNILNKKILIDKDCFGFGKVTWNTKGNQFIYQRIEYPPTDYPVANVYLIKINETGEIISKKEVIKKIGYTDFNWSSNDIIVFSDFDIVYIFDTNSNKMIQISGNWTKGLKDHTRQGYPRWCNSFIWITNKDLEFSFKPNMYDDFSKYYKITFKSNK
jgi:hypothetical protein